MNAKLSFSVLCPLLFLLISCSSDNNPTSTTIYQTAAEPNRWALVGSFGTARVIASNGSALVAGTDYYGARRSSDDGITWDSIVGLPNRMTGLVAVSGDFFAVVYPDGIYRSSDGGVNWVLSSSGIGSSVGVSIITENGSVPFVAMTDGRFFRGSDKGLMWDLVNNAGLPDSTQFVTAMAAAGDDLVAIIGNSSARGIYRYSHSSSTWALMPEVVWVNKVLFFYAHGGRLYAGTSVGLYRSLDLGQTWTATKLTTYSTYALAAKPDGSTIFAAVGGPGVVRSDDDGASWVVTGPIGNVLALHKNYLFALDGPAVWRLKID